MGEDALAQLSHVASNGGGSMTHEITLSHVATLLVISLLLPIQGTVNEPTMTNVYVTPTVTLTHSLTHCNMYIYIFGEAQKIFLDISYKDLTYFDV